MVTVKFGLAQQTQAVLQGFALILLALLAVVLVGASVLAAFGQVPWLDLEARFGGAEIPAAGTYAQLLLTALAVALCFFLPANARMMRLERSHRAFQLSMADVVEAYRQAHSADRAGVFALSGEFDAMRERLNHLRRHPDLASLEPDLLEVAAQMSLASRDLARTYSDEKVARAKELLKARQQEAAAFQERLTMATSTCAELKRWLQDIEADETVAARQVERLERDLRDILPALGYDFEDQANVVQMPSKPAR